MPPKKVLLRFEYSILVPFRYNKRWVTLADKTISLAKCQAVFLLRSGKIAPHKTTIKGDVNASTN